VLKDMNILMMEHAYGPQLDITATSMAPYCSENISQWKQQGQWLDRQNRTLNTHRLE